MKDFFNSWVFIVITIAIFIGAYIAYHNELHMWAEKPLSEATIGDVAIIALYASVYIQITRK